MEEKWKDLGLAVGVLAALFAIGATIYNLNLDLAIKLFLANIVAIVLLIIYVNLSFEKKKPKLTQLIYTG